MKLHNIEQNTPEWHDLRKLRMTASNAQAIASQGKGLQTYIYELIAGYMAKEELGGYDNPDMLRGRLLEDEAMFIYSLASEEKIQRVGFVEADKYVGCSPDGLVGDKGLVEIKCKNNAKHIRQFHLGLKEVEAKYMWQMQMQMLVCEREWCDFVSYNNSFEPPYNIFKLRVSRHEESIKSIEGGLEMGADLIKEVLGGLGYEE